MVSLDSGRSDDTSGRQGSYILNPKVHRITCDLTVSDDQDIHRCPSSKSLATQDTSDFELLLPLHLHQASHTMKRLINRNKPRLLLGLYARPKHPDSPHYALLITPKITPSQNQALPASKYHVKNTLEVVNDQPSQPWRFEQTSLQDIAEDPRLLVAVVIGKVVSLDTAEETLRQTPVYQIHDPDREKALTFDCRIWVRDALDGLRASDCVSSLVDWDTLDQRALGYMQQKKESGIWIAGRGESGKVGIPVLDLLTGEEVEF